LLNGKKRSGNTTSNYMITIDQDKMKKGTKGYLGKLRSNFLGTEFYLYDTGKNPKKAKTPDDVRE
jgi:tubby-related protein 1